MAKTTEPTTDKQPAKAVQQKPIAEIVVAIASCGIGFVRRQAGKMSDGDQSKLRAAYANKKNPRGVLQAILDRQTEDAKKTKGDVAS